MFFKISEDNWEDTTLDKTVQFHLHECPSVYNHEESSI